MSLLIKGGKVINPATAIEEELDILVKGSKIEEIGKDLRIDKVEEVIDARGKIVTPGLIDMHVHLREPGFEDKEDIASGTRSAAQGGFTTVACMPNTNPVIDNETVVEFIKAKANRDGVVNVYPIGSITKRLEGKEITEAGYLYKAGIVALSDDGKPVMNSEVMRRALEYSKTFNLPIISHCEDQNLAADGMMNESYMSTVIGLKGIPNAAESIMVSRDIILAEMVGAPVHIAHVSTKESVDLIRGAKERGVKITAEAAPHHFTLTEEAVTSFDTSTKVNPPLRSRADVEAVKEGLKDGTIDVIATDHAPHTKEQKAVEYIYAPFGMVGLETALPLVITHLINPGVLSLSEAIAKLTINPAKILGLSEKGNLEPGKDADITIIDLEKEFIVDREKLASKGKNTPFHGWYLRGKAVRTIVAGETVMLEGKIVLKI